MKVEEVVLQPQPQPPLPTLWYSPPSLRVPVEATLALVGDLVPVDDGPLLLDVQQLRVQQQPLKGTITTPQAAGVAKIVFWSFRR